VTRIQRPCEKRQPADPNAPRAWQRLTPRAARSILAVALLGAAACVAITLSPLAKGKADDASRGANDMTLYRSEVIRVAQGEAYYDVAGDELRTQGYPTKSVFNWRTPLLVWLLAVLPSPQVGQAILGGLATVLTLWAMVAVAQQRGPGAGALAGCLLCGATLLVTGDAYFLPVMWSGVLIGLSLCAYAFDRRAMAVALGLTALFFRELAAPYCLGAVVLAVYDRRWREVLAWSAGVAAYAAFYAFHVHEVQARILTTDVGHDGTWWQAGGLAFVISLAQTHSFLLVLPQAAAALYFALAMLGAASWDSAWGRRVGLTLCGYAATFALVGYEFNQYWGVLISPLFALCAAQSPAAMADLMCRGGLLNTGLPTSGRAASDGLRGSSRS
jgi:hypothetical protein